MDSKSTQLGNSDVGIVTKKTVKKEKTQKDTKQAISITLGDQSENHVGMAKQGSGLAERGYTKEDIEKLAMQFVERLEPSDITVYYINRDERIITKIKLKNN